MDNQNDNREIAIKVSNVKKKYKLGQIGGGTLQADLQSWWAKVRGKEDPNSKIGSDQRSNGKTFMALNGLDMTIYKGEAVGIIGSNGAGKSTLLKLLSRVTAPTEGEIDIYGRVASMLEVGTGFNGEMTGRENVYLNGAILGMTKEEIDTKMEDIIEFSEVREFIDTPVKRYSSGMYVKLAFSVAAHLDSEIMIMDEVLAVGDMTFQKKCLDKMRDVAKKEGRTVLYVSHNMNTIRQLCDRCIVLEKGCIKFSGDVEEAIGIYIHKNGRPEVYNDYSQSERDDGVNHQIVFQSLELLTKSNLIECGKKLSVRLSFFSKVSTDKLIIRFNFYPGNKEVFATSLTEYLTVEAGKNYIKDFTIDTSSFSPEKYRVRMVAFEPNMYGGQMRYDNIDEAFYFEMYSYMEEFNMKWDNYWWGNYIMPKVKEDHKD